MVLDGVSFDVQEGEWLAIVGHNGSGKSTLAKLIDGLLEAAGGEITIEDQLLTPDNLWELRDDIGLVFQNPDNQFVGATVADDVAFGLENRGVERNEMKRRVAEALVQVGMDGFEEREPTSLSGGQKQRVALAGVIAIRPRVVILDEATSMLDPEGRREILRVIRELKDRFQLTVISITHDIEEAAHASRVLIINDGRIVEEGQPEAIFEKEAELLELGLDIPYASRLKRSLNQLGIQVPEQYLNEEEMANWLCQSLLKK
ncbi:cobalt ABC transporter ATP-binding protein [Secundilactobacillus oryzae JCM 18671]|uniref:Cobalt ABC transporter ATP-binding protein n=2 Tax=Secundilactobacillus oryzae TaxID=1202668 RepID=A0A081BK62_9LACO|nr:cobalt ABC transporter ATP-binding protein [Secundilactobacillus oryzae JCM 18671]